MMLRVIVGDRNSSRYRPRSVISRRNLKLPTAAAGGELYYIGATSLASRIACFPCNEFHASRVFPRRKGRANRQREREGGERAHELYAPRAFFTRQSRSIFRVVAASLVPLLRVCFCLAEEIPRDRVRRQLHIDRILENRQFRSAPFTLR